MCVNFRALCNIIESITRDSIRPVEEELLALGVNQAEKDMVLSKCVSSQQHWAAKKAKLTISVISNADNVPIFDPHEVARRLCSRRGDIFRARTSDIPNDRAETMLALVQPAPPELSWNIGLDELEELLASKRESAPEQDVCLTVCTALLAVLEQNFISLLIRQCLQGATLLVGFGASLTLFIPKSSQTDAHGHIIRSPEALRPPTLYATVTAKSLMLSCATYEDTLSSAFTLHRDASPSVSSRITFLKSRRGISPGVPSREAQKDFPGARGGWRLASGYLFTLAFDPAYR